MGKEKYKETFIYIALSIIILIFAVLGNIHIPGPWKNHQRLNDLTTRVEQLENLE